MLARQHEKIQNLSGIVMPNRRQERDNPAKADESYEAATSYLIAKTRNHDAYPLVFAENCNYGFRRNMLGLRTFGISISAVGFLGAAVPFLLSVFDGLEVSRFSFALVAALCLVELIMWSIVVKADWVRRAADAYAARLMEAVETLQRSQDPEPPGAAGSTISPAPNA
jgi:hypothetical protein